MARCKKHVFFLLLLISAVAAVLVPVSDAEADHYVGSELTYAYTGTPGIYLVRLRFYRDCGGINLYGNMPIEVYSPGCAPSPVTFLLELNYKQEISEVCPGQATECTTPANNAVPGVEVFEYTAIINLSSISQQCNNWVFYLQGSARNEGIINLNDGNSMYLSYYTAAEVNAAPGIQNSSPVFASSPVPFVCVLDTVNYNLQATDPDGDSLVYTLAGALGSNGVVIPYTLNYWAQQPFGSYLVNGYPTTLNPQTGQLSFRAMATGAYVVVIKIDEWRTINGQPVLVGAMRRDVQVQVVQCNSPAPQLQPLTLTQNGAVVATFLPSAAQQVEACVPYCITIPLVTNAADTSVTITLTSNAEAEIQGSVFTVTGQNTQNPVGQLCFVANPLLDGEIISFTVKGEDNACPFTNEVSRAILLQIIKSTGVAAQQIQTPICAGESVQLSALPVPGKLPLSDPAYTSISWSAYDMLGQPIMGQFQGNDSSTYYPEVFPAQTTRYVLSVTTSFGCTDTASVVVPVKGITPDIEQISAHNLILCQNQTTALTPIVSAPPNVNFPVTWSAAWFPAPGLSDTSVFSPVIAYAGQQSVTYPLIISNGACSDSSSVTISFALDSVTLTACYDSVQICVGDVVQLTASALGPGSAAGVYSWIYGDRIFDTAEANTTAIPAKTGNNLYVSQMITENGCRILDSVLVAVSGVKIDIEPFPDNGISLCQGQAFQIQPVIKFDSAVTEPELIYTWSPATGLTDSTILNPEISYAGQTPAMYTLTVSSGACSAAATLEVHFVPSFSVSGSVLQNEFCLGDTIPLSATVSPPGLQGAGFFWSGNGVLDLQSNVTNAVPSALGNQLYIVSAFLGNACESIDTVQVSINGVRPIISDISAMPNPACEGDSVVFFSTVKPPVLVADDYVFGLRWWSGNGNTSLEGLQNPVVSAHVTSPDWFYFEASDNGICLAKDSVWVDVTAAPELDFTINYYPDSLTPVPVTVYFENKSGGNFSEVIWEVLAPCNDVFSVFGTGDFAEKLFTENGNFLVKMKVQTPSGCEFEKVKPLHIGAYIPANIITPNGDGLNDEFYVPGLKPGSKVQIFNRWGKAITEFGAEEKWAPQQELPSGIYFYNVQQNNGGNSYKGWLEIMH